MHSKWILLAEDNEDDLVLALRAIKRVDPEIRVVVARDGEEALELLGLNEGCELPLASPELVLLDLKMPRRGGKEVLEAVRACDPYRLVPVVMLTSSDEPSDLIDCYHLGANSYTVKPVDYDVFIEQMASTVSYWTRINRVPKLTAAASRAA